MKSSREWADIIAGGIVKWEENGLPYWDGTRKACEAAFDRAMADAYRMGAESHELPCYTVEDTPPERRTNPRGDVARASVDAVLNGGEPQRIPPRMYAGFPACYLAPVPETKEID